MNPYGLLRYVRPIELGEALKRVLNPKRVIVESNGCRFLVDPLSNFGGTLLSLGKYEDETTRWLLKVLAKGDTFVDVGANEGWYSLIAARIVGPSGCILAIEPQERCWSAIHRNFILNNYLKYRVVPYAVGDVEGETHLILYPSLNNEASTLVSQRRTRRFKRQYTRVTTLDTITRTLETGLIKLLKIDCEGYELGVLRGAEKLLKDGMVEHLLVEIHARQLVELGHQESEITEYLLSLGFNPSNDLRFWTRGSLGPNSVERNSPEKGR